MLAPKLPQGFGPYMLVQRLAQGGMAEVFLARQRSSSGIERNLVIKRILPHLAEDREFLTMFQQEARLAMQLSHPNIVHTYDFGREGDKFYIALEYVDGPSLQTLLKHSRKPVPKAIAVRIACGVAAGLAYAHQATDELGNHLGLVHRDVSPPNVLVARDGSVKLVDFGIAKALHRTPGTHSTTLKGKFAYMAPEQFDGEVTQRVDIYALGVCLYEMLSGEPLFRQKTVAELIRAVCASEIDPLATRAPWVPEALEAIVMRALHRDPEQRYQSAETLLLVLERFLTQQGLVASPMLVGEWVRDALAQPASKRKMPTLDDPPPSALDARESDPFDITAVRRQPAERARSAASEDTPPSSMPAPRDTMPQDYLVLSSHPAGDAEGTDETVSPQEPERTPVDDGPRQPPPPVRPTVGPAKRTPVPFERTRRATPQPATPVEFEKSTAPRAAVLPTPPEGDGTLDEAAAKLASPPSAKDKEKKGSHHELAAAAAPLVKAPLRRPSGPVSATDDDKTIADPEARPPEAAKAPDDTDRTLSLPPDRKLAPPDKVHLLAQKLASIPDPTEPSLPSFPMKSGGPAPKAPAPTREPPRPAPAPLAAPPTTPSASMTPADPTPAPASRAQRETKPAPPPTGPMDLVPAVTTPLPRVTPQAPAMFTAKPPAEPKQAELPAVGKREADKTAELVTGDLQPLATPPPIAEDAKATLLRAPEAAPAAPPLAFGPVVSGEGAKSRLEFPPELLRHTPASSDSLTDVVTSAAFSMPDLGAAAPADLDTEATRVKLGSESAASPVGPADVLAAARDSEPITMGPTIVLADGVAREPAFSGPVGPEIQSTTEKVVRPSVVVGPGKRSRVPIALAAIGVVLVAGTIGLYFASVSHPDVQPPPPQPGPDPTVTQGIATTAQPPPSIYARSSDAQAVQVAQVEPPPVAPTLPVDPAPSPTPSTPPPPADPAPRVTPTTPRHAQAAPPTSPRPRNPVDQPRPRNPVLQQREPAGGTGRLFVNTDPWSHVLVNGRDVGTTPVANIEVPSGRVRLTLIDPDGHRVSRTVNVPAGGEKRAYFQLQ